MAADWSPNPALLTACLEAEPRGGQAQVVGGEPRRVRARASRPWALERECIPGDPPTTWVELAIAGKQE